MSNAMLLRHRRVTELETRVLIALTGAETRGEARRALWGYAFALPWILGLLFFVVGPLFMAMFLSFTEYHALSSPRWVGLANYERALLQDPLVWPSLGRTLYYTFAVVPIGTLGSLLFAMLLNQRVPGRSAFRTFVFLPHLTPSVAAAIVWAWLLHPHLGPVNSLLGTLGLPQPGWLADRHWAIPSMILISSWMSWGGNRMLIFLAGLQGVPDELYEACAIDGAGAWARFRHITLPMISPVILFNLVLGVIGALKIFDLAFVATQGGPSYATWFFALHIYRHAFQYFQMGYGLALSWLFAFLVMIFTMFQFGISRRWVFYAGVSSS